jgi:pimeloyl-ACP methyl ester carboxylesterase
VVIAALALAGCGHHGTTGPLPGQEPAAKMTPAPATAALPQPSQRCGDPAIKATLVSLTTSDGVKLDGVELGSGPKGAVFLHESPADLCNWWPFAGAIEKAGVHALLLDLRCFGESACPKGAGSVDPAADVAAAVARLRGDGAKTVVVVGASYGGASALVAGSKDKVDGVASLSGEPDLDPALDVNKVIHALTAPLFMAVSRGDGYVSPAQARTMVRNAGSTSKRLVVEGREAGHGTEMLVGDDGMTPTRLFGTLMAFIRAH